MAVHCTERGVNCLLISHRRLNSSHQRDHGHVGGEVLWQHNADKAAVFQFQNAMAQLPRGVQIVSKQNQ
jgi:hypothetical protein